MAGTEDPAVGGGGPGQLVQVSGAAAGHLRLRQAHGGHAELPVILHHLVQVLRGCAGKGRAVGPLAVRARPERPQPLRRLLVADLAELPGHGPEQPALVPGMAGHQRHLPGGACRQGLPRRRGKYLAVHHRRVRGLRQRDPAPAVLVAPELAVHRVPGGHQRRRVHGGQVRHRGPQAELSGDGPADVGGQRRRVVDARHALRDRPAEQARCPRGGEQRGDRPGPGRLAEDGDQGRVPAEGSDVVAHPFQRCHLVEQAPVGWRPRDLGEALGAGAVVEG
jgi:hypothetical protein